MIRRCRVGAVLLSMLGATVLTAGIARAQPSAIGSTGFLITPDGNIAPRAKMLHFGLVKVNDLADFWKVNWGIEDRFEIGATLFKPEAASFRWVLMNAKLKLVPEENNVPAIAIGVFDAGDRLDRNIYIAASKLLKGRAPVVVGLGYSGGDVLMRGVFGTIAVVPVKNLALVGEWDSEKFNAGIRFWSGNGINVDIGRVRSEFAVGVSYQASLSW